MKLKNLWMVPAISIAASTSAFSQAVADVPAAAKVNKNAEQFDAQKSDKMLGDIVKMIEKAAADEGKKVDGKKILDILGLGHVDSYAYSSDKMGTEWLNHIYLHDNGANKGAFQLLGGNAAKFAVPTMCPNGTDLALQLRLNLKEVEALIGELMAAGGADLDEIGEFKNGMKEEIPGMEMTVSEMLKKVNIRLNIAIDLDKENTLDIQGVEIDKPHLVIRIDGVNWAWKLIEQQIADAQLPLKRTEKDGIIKLEVPAEMGAMLKGYVPLIVMDTKKDQLWIASSLDFLKRCKSGENTLADSMAYKATMKGLPKDGNSLFYMSKDLAETIVEMYEKYKDDAGIEGPEVEKAMKQLKAIKTGSVMLLSRDEKGLHIGARSTESMEDMIKDIQKTIVEAQKKAQ